MNRFLSNAWTLIIRQFPHKMDYRDLMETLPQLEQQWPSPLSLCLGVASAALTSADERHCMSGQHSKEGSNSTLNPRPFVIRLPRKTTWLKAETSDAISQIMNGVIHPLSFSCYRPSIKMSVLTSNPSPNCDWNVKSNHQLSHSNDTESSGVVVENLVSSKCCGLLEY